MEEKRSEELANISKEIEEVTSSTGDPEYVNMTAEECSSHSSSSETSAPQPFKKSIADMEEEQNKPHITLKEFKALKRSNYDKISSKFQYSYVIRNKKNGMVVEVKAASSLHAANIIGWRPRHTELIEVIDTQKVKETNSEKKETVEEPTSAPVT
jgi:hypothetical protein